MRYPLSYVIGTGIFCLTSCIYADSPTPSQVEPDDSNLDLFNKDKSVFFVTGEYLCWHANEGAVDFAVKMNQPAWSTTDNTYAVGNYHNAEFDWSSGVRIGFGYFRAPHYWDMFLQYTYVPSFGFNETHAPDKAGEFLNGTWIHPDVSLDNGALPLKRASSRIKFDYHLLEMLMSRRFHTNPHFRLNLFGGLTTAFLYHDWNVFYEDTAHQESKIHNHWKFEGLGLRLGLKLDWYLGWDLYLTALSSAGILSGWYENSASQKTDAAVAGADSSRPLRDVHFHDGRLTYTAQFMAGPSWQKVFKTVRTEIMIGYEFNIWTNLQQIYRSGFTANTAAKETFINGSNISLQGFTLRTNLDF